MAQKIGMSQDAIHSKVSAIPVKSSWRDKYSVTSFVLNKKIIPNFSMVSKKNSFAQNAKITAINVGKSVITAFLSLAALFTLAFDLIANLVRKAISPEKKEQKLQQKVIAKILAQEKHIFRDHKGRIALRGLEGERAFMEVQLAAKEYVKFLVEGGYSELEIKEKLEDLSKAKALDLPVVRRAEAEVIFTRSLGEATNPQLKYSAGRMLLDSYASKLSSSIRGGRVPYLDSSFARTTHGINQMMPPFEREDSSELFVPEVEDTQRSVFEKVSEQVGENQINDLMSGYQEKISNRNDLVQVPGQPEQEMVKMQLDQALVSAKKELELAQNQRKEAENILNSFNKTEGRKTFTKLSEQAEKELPGQEGQFLGNLYSQRIHLYRKVVGTKEREAQVKTGVTNIENKLKEATQALKHTQTVKFKQCVERFDSDARQRLAMLDSIAKRKISGRYLPKVVNTPDIYKSLRAI